MECEMRKEEENFEKKFASSFSLFFCSACTIRATVQVDKSSIKLEQARLGTVPKIMGLKKKTPKNLLKIMSFLSAYKVVAACFDNTHLLLIFSRHKYFILSRFLLKVAHLRERERGEREGERERERERRERKREREAPIWKKSEEAFTNGSPDLSEERKISFPGRRVAR